MKPVYCEKLLQNRELSLFSAIVVTKMPPVKSSSNSRRMM